MSVSCADVLFTFCLCLCVWERERSGKGWQGHQGKQHLWLKSETYISQQQNTLFSALSCWAKIRRQLSMMTLSFFAQKASKTGMPFPSPSRTIMVNYGYKQLLTLYVQSISITSGKFNAIEIMSLVVNAAYKKLPLLSLPTWPIPPSLSHSSKIWHFSAWNGKICWSLFIKKRKWRYR